MNAAQKSELHKWRNTPEGQHFTESEKKKCKKAPASNRGPSEKKLQSAIRSALTEEHKKQKQYDDTIESMAQMIASAAAKTVPSTDKPANASIMGAHCNAAVELLKFKAHNASATAKSTAD